VNVPIGSPTNVELPPTVYRGRLVGMLFDSDKTFLLPSALRGIKELKQLYDRYPGSQVLVVGHADKKGDATYNRKLSEERAKIIAAYLQDDAATWMGAFDDGRPAGKKWGTLEDQHMLRTVAGFEGPATGKLDDATKAALKEWPRKKLVETYQAQDETTLPKGTVLQTHGCGESHPEADGDDEESLRQNRRVEVFLFQGPIEPAPEGSCPTGGCTQYAEWVGKTVETIDLAEAPENAVELFLGWPVHVADALTDVTLTLDGTNVARQEKKLSAARKEDGFAVVSFRWLDRDAQITLEAKGGKKSVTLFRDQVVGELAVACEWTGELEELLPEEKAAPEPSGEGTVVGGIGDDLDPVVVPKVRA
jgi:hypothetical protein